VSGQRAKKITSPGGAGDADLAAVGALLAEPARARILLALGDGRALPASVLAAEAGVAASTATGHLSKLVQGGLLTVEPSGRHRYFRLAGPQVGRLIETVAALAPAIPVRSLRDGTRAAALRRARTCYDHLAGRVGTDLFESLLDAGHVTGGDGHHHPDRAPTDTFAGHGHDVDYRLSKSGNEALTEIGVTLPAPGDDGTIGLRYCVDWTEQRHHLAGAVGRSLTGRMVELGWLRRAERTRAVHITDTGRAKLRVHFGLST
jgi:DNA-binding transcriptional ArsR family regulator